MRFAALPGRVKAGALRSRYTRSVQCALLRLLPAILTITLLVRAQITRPKWDGLYTQEEAARGKAAYAEQCASCHGAQLGGGDETPALAGEKFLTSWHDRSVDDLSERIQGTMPVGRPGSLSAQMNTDIVAYILASNRFALAGGKLLTSSRVLARAPTLPSLPAFMEGKPVESRPPENPKDRPSFPEQTRAPYHATAPYSTTTLIDNLPAPWSLAFLPDGRILITERLPGSIRILDNKGTLSGPVAGVSGLASSGAKEIGLLDVVLDPNFTKNRRIFFTFFDYIDGTNSNTYVARATLDADKCAVSDARVIFRALPAIPSKRLGGKTGGRIAIARDGTLFVPIGDRSDSPPWDVAQRLDNHLGKIIHITVDGAPAPDNPFLGKPGVLPEIWAYGLRSPQGLAFDPRTGRLWEHEHGPRGGDELNIIERGRNYGWPVVTRGIDYPGGTIGEGLIQKDGMEEPVYYWDPVIAPSGLAFYTGNLFPQWRGSLFIGGLRSTMLDRLKIVNDKVVAEEPLLTELQARIRDVRLGADGAIYVLTDSGNPGIQPDTPHTARLVKLTPK
jgi:glucose/arabinose dehydrogenase